MEITFRAADAGQIDLLTEMMREFCACDHHPFDERAVHAALRQLLSGQELGSVYLMLSDGEVAGYVVLTFGFSLEHGGRDASIDEIFVKEGQRGRGIGSAALRFVEDVCRQRGVRALHLEVERANTTAQSLYRGAGFAEYDRRLMTKMI